MPLVAETSESFDKVVEGTSEVSGLVVNISSSSKEQAVSTQEINSSMSAVDNSIQQIVNNAEESVKTAEDLNVMYDQMKNVADALALLVNGNQGLNDGGSGGTSLVGAKREDSSPCWEGKNCPPDRQQECPAYPDFGDTC